MQLAVCAQHLPETICGDTGFYSVQQLPTTALFLEALIDSCPYLLDHFCLVPVQIWFL